MSHILSLKLLATLGSEFGSPSLQFWDYTIFAVYIAASVLLGLMAGGKQKDLRTYLLAGNQMHWAMIAISILAALFSGISFLGAPAEAFGHNLIHLWTLLTFLIATPITTLVFLPLFFRLNLYTAYEYLEHRFDLRLRRVSSAAFIFRVSLWLALAIYAPSLVISEMTGTPVWISVVLAGAVTLLYTTIGGMRAVIYTDVMQFGVLLLGIGAVLWVASDKTPGGLIGAWKIAEAGGRTKFIEMSFSLTDRMTLLGAFVGGIFINLVALVTDQVSVQRYLTASSLKESQRALWAKLFLTVPLVGLFYYTGITLYAYYETHPEMATSLLGADRVLPYFISRELMSPLPGLLIAAILAATMSTVSAGVNALTTATLMDFVYVGKGETVGNVEEHARVGTARLWTMAYGVIVTFLALGVNRLGTFVEASNKITGFFGGPLLGIFILGVLSRRANAPGTLIGATAGFVLVFVIGLFTEVSFMWYAMIGCLATCVAGEIMSRAFLPPTGRQRSFSLFPVSGNANVQVTSAANSSNQDPLFSAQTDCRD